VTTHLVGALVGTPARRVVRVLLPFGSHARLDVRWRGGPRAHLRALASRPVLPTVLRAQPLLPGVVLALVLPRPPLAREARVEALPVTRSPLQVQLYA